MFVYVRVSGILHQSCTDPCWKKRNNESFNTTHKYYTALSVSEILVQWLPSTGHLPLLHKYYRAISVSEVLV